MIIDGAMGSMVQQYKLEVRLSAPRKVKYIAVSVMRVARASCEEATAHEGVFHGSGRSFPWKGDLPRRRKVDHG